MRDREMAHNKSIPTQDGIPHVLNKECILYHSHIQNIDVGIVHGFAGTLFR